MLRPTTTYCAIKRRQRCFNCRHYTEGITRENDHKWRKPWWDKAVTLTTWNPSIWSKHRKSCNDSSNYRQWHVHHIITCQINSALKHLCCGWAEKQFKPRGVTVQGPRQEITYCPETQVPTNNLTSELKQDTTQNGLLCYLQLCLTPNTSRFGTSNTKAVQWQQRSIRSYLWRPKTSHIQGPNVFISSKTFLHTIKPLLLFLCLQYWQSQLPLHGLSSECRWWRPKKGGPAA
jgi:hypothetical protein